MKKILLEKYDDYRLINQSGIRQKVVPNPTMHNATWDSILTADGRFFFSLCSELTTSEYAKLAEYDYDTNTIKECFYSKDYIQSNDRFIRDSKFHTCFDVTNDDKLIMITHTTDKAPEHPAWMPFANYANPWEGFIGSSLLTYNLKTGEVENHGIPVQRETLYGAAYDAINNDYYMLGFVKGHLYRYNLDKRTTEDLGKQAERASYRMIHGSDKNIYFTTRNGVLKRINSKTRQVENTNQTLPNASQSKGMPRSYLTAGVSDSEGKLYLSGQYHDEISVYDTYKDELTVLGKYTPYEQWMNNEQMSQYIGGMAFDKNDVLWYVICNLRLDQKEDFLPAALLMCWDVKNKDKPEYLGLIGTENRAVVRTSDIYIDLDRDLLYIPGTNHGADGTEITVLDLTELRKNKELKGPICKDPVIKEDNKEYALHGEQLAAHWAILDENPHTMTYKSISAYPMDKPVRALKWDGDTLNIQFEDETMSALTIEGIKKESTISALSDPKIDSSLNSLRISGYPGRQYRNNISKVQQMKNGQLLANQDGFIAYKTQDSILNFGPVSTFGTVQDMCVSPDGETVYGIAGDKDDLDMVFKFKADSGIERLGVINCDGPVYGSHASYDLSSCDHHDERQIIAIGSNDEMPTIYIISL